jgi:hypothetical protein
MRLFLNSDSYADSDALWQTPGPLAESSNANAQNGGSTRPLAGLMAEICATTIGVAVRVVVKFKYLNAVQSAMDMVSATIQRG